MKFLSFELSIGRKPHSISMLSYNVLSAMKSLALPGALGSARPKQLPFLLFNITERIISTGGRLVLRIAAEVDKRIQLIAERLRLRSLTLPIPTG